MRRLRAAPRALRMANSWRRPLTRERMSRPVLTAQRSIMSAQRDSRRGELAVLAAQTGFAGASGFHAELISTAEEVGVESFVWGRLRW